jgi:hypothetical protein
MPNPPYSPDIAPPGFWLFGYVKDSLAGRLFDEPEQLLEAITEFLNEMQPSELEVVFIHWLLEKQWRLLPRVEQSFPETTVSSLSWAPAPRK